MEEIRKQILNFFSGLTFEEDSHTYLVKGKKLKRSVSDLVNNFTVKVNFSEKADKKDERLGLPAGTTSQMWKNNADLACAKGNKAHFFGEIYAFHRNVKPTDGFERAVVKFWSELPKHVVPVFTELKMYHFQLMFGGMMDILLYNKNTKKFLIVDYKSNSKLFDNFKGKTLKKPFHDLLETNFNKYQLQFSFYQLLFEQTGFEVERRILVWLKKEGEYLMYDTEDYTSTLKEYLKMETS